jgi:hypothetical protein
LSNSTGAKAFPRRAEAYLAELKAKLETEGDEAERSIEEFKRLSGRGRAGSWRFNRDEIHERR